MGIVNWYRFINIGLDNKGRRHVLTVEQTREYIIKEWCHTVLYTESLQFRPEKRIVR